MNIGSINIDYVFMLELTLCCFAEYLSSFGGCAFDISSDFGCNLAEADELS